MLIDESYNANPASMRAALELLRDTPVRLRGRRVAVTMANAGRMGPVYPSAVHRELADRCDEPKADTRLPRTGPNAGAQRTETRTEIETVLTATKCGRAGWPNTQEQVLRDR